MNSIPQGRSGSGRNETKKEPFKISIDQTHPQLSCKQQAALYRDNELGRKLPPAHPPSQNRGNKNRLGIRPGRDGPRCGCPRPNHAPEASNSRYHHMKRRRRPGEGVTCVCILFLTQTPGGTASGGRRRNDAHTTETRGGRCPSRTAGRSRAGRTRSPRVSPAPFRVSLWSFFTAAVV